MESRHTPGPWAVGNTDPLLFGKSQGNRTEPLGFVYGPALPEKSELGRRALANALLIAAAPELLEALQGVLHEYRDGYGLACVEQVRAAIVKATGHSL